MIKSGLRPTAQLRIATVLLRKTDRRDAPFATDVSFNENITIDEPERYNSEEAILKYASDKEVTDYYRDYYIENQYLIVEVDCLTSFFALDGFIKTESVQYEDIVRVDINFVGELGSVEIMDKAGGSLFFVFDSEIAKEVKKMCDERK